MTLILLCYICGQGEKVRLAMWMLIVAVTGYIKLFGMGIASNKIYAMNIGISQGQTEIVVEQKVTSYTNTNSNTPTVDAPPKIPMHVTMHQEQPTSKKSMPQEQTVSSIDGYLTQLLLLEGVFPDHAAYQGNNKIVLEFTHDKLLGKPLKTQQSFLKKLIETLSSLSAYEQKQYAINGETLIPLLQFVIIKGESVEVSSGTQPTHQHMTKGIFTKFTISEPTPGMHLFTMKEEQHVKRLNIYVNDIFVHGCDGKQCKRFPLYGEKGDTVTIYYKEGHISHTDEYIL